MGGTVKGASMRSPLGKARGHGSGHSGTGHFIAQRVSAVALLILAPWFVVSAGVSMRNPDYVGAIDYLTAPHNAVGVILLVIAGLYHMRLGMAVVIEDYIAKPFTKSLLLTLNTLLVVALGASAVFAVLSINFGA